MAGLVFETWNTRQSLETEHNELMAHVKHFTMTDGQLTFIEEFCATIRTGLDLADFQQREK